MATALGVVLIDCCGRTWDRLFSFIFSLNSCASYLSATAPPPPTPYFYVVSLAHGKAVSLDGNFSRFLGRHSNKQRRKSLKNLELRKVSFTFMEHKAFSVKASFHSKDIYCCKQQTMQSRINGTLTLNSISPKRLNPFEQDK